MLNIVTKHLFSHLPTRHIVTKQCPLFHNLKYGHPIIEHAMLTYKDTPFGPVLGLGFLLRTLIRDFRLLSLPLSPSLSLSLSLLSLFLSLARSFVLPLCLTLELLGSGHPQRLTSLPR